MSVTYSQIFQKKKDKREGKKKGGGNIIDILDQYICFYIEKELK